MYYLYGSSTATRAFVSCFQRFCTQGIIVENLNYIFITLNARATTISESQFGLMLVQSTVEVIFLLKTPNGKIERLVKIFIWFIFF